ncbi:MAG: hypothetical protein JO197_23455 [Acidobacteria bacterium]|nr:hypothetical protein [Acidobacteriota bacterium]MBV9477834.1 hypothetical protein [Acidobacteriota bacterium]
MFIDFLRLLALPLAGIALFLLYRFTESGDRRISILVAAGFLSRALVGQALFWISYLRLPVGRSLQIGEGLWFFAQDGVMYAGTATAAAQHGLDAILRMFRGTSSVSYVQTLSLFTLLFGNAVSVSLLLNLFCYAATCAILVRWAEAVPSTRQAVLLAIAAISLSPAGILWSFQPLKESFFQFLVIGFVAACFLWQRAWRTGGPSARTLLGAAAAMFATCYLASGVRWYIGLALLLAAALFLMLVALGVRARKVAAFASALVVIFVLTRTFLFAADAYVPPVMARALRFNLTSAADVPSDVERYVEATRSGFERTGGKTAIRTTAAPPPVPPPTRASVNAPPSPPAALTPVATTAATSTRSTTVATTSANAPSPVPAPKPATPPTTVATNAKPAVTATATSEAKPTVVVFYVPRRVPESRARRLLSGAAAAALPRTIGERLGLVNIGSSAHGAFWLFVDVDTLFFDLVLLAAGASVFLGFRNGWYRNALFWLVLVLTLVTGVLLVYTVTNFGTLFRLRAMIFNTLVLLPLAVATVPVREPDALPEPAAGGALSTEQA